MSQNAQTHFKNFAAIAAGILKCVWPYWDIMQQSVNLYTLIPIPWPTVEKNNFTNGFFQKAMPTHILLSP